MDRIIFLCIFTTVKYWFWDFESWYFLLLVQIRNVVVTVEAPLEEFMRNDFPDVVTKICFLYSDEVPLNEFFKNYRKQFRKAI